MLERIIAVDSGKHSTKAVIKRSEGVTKKKFLTKMDPTSNTKPINHDSFVIDFEGKRYMIGDEAETFSFDVSKKEDIHRVATYTAIANLVDNGDIVTAGIGCPLSVFINNDAREQYKDYILPKGKQINIIINGSEKRFTIKKAMVFPESSGVIYLNPLKYANRIVGVIDIGGLNTNCCVYKKMAPIPSTMVTNNLGGNIMENELRLKLNTTFGTNLQDYIMSQVLTDGFIKKDIEASSRLISDYKKAHIQKIIEECKKKQWDFESMDIIFAGGASMSMKNEILEVFPDALVDVLDENAPYLNAEGFLKIMTMSNQN